MEPRKIAIAREMHEGSGSKGRFVLCDVIEGLDALLKTHEGQIKLIYLDPPFQTGERFTMRVRVGEADWKAGRGSLEMETFSDSMSRDEFLAMMRAVLAR